MESVSNCLPSGVDTKFCCGGDDRLWRGEKVGVTIAEKRPLNMRFQGAELFFKVKYLLIFI